MLSKLNYQNYLRSSDGFANFLLKQTISDINFSNLLPPKNWIVFETAKNRNRFPAEEDSLYVATQGSAAAIKIEKKLRPMQRRGTNAAVFNEYFRVKMSKWVQVKRQVHWCVNLVLPTTTYFTHLSNISLLVAILSHGSWIGLYKMVKSPAVWIH